MGEKKSSNIKKRMLKFLDKQGFYVILFICVCIIAVAAFFTTRSNKQDELDLQKLGLKQQEQEDEVEQQQVSEQESKIKVKDVVEQEDVIAKSVDEQTEQQAYNQQKIDIKPQQITNISKSESVPASSINIAMLEPVSGNIIMDYGRENLVYSNTLKQWCSHDGIDIEALETTPVKAVFDGVVSDIRTDDKLGILIEIDHQNGFKSVYANLSTDKMVQVGQEVEKGQVISGVGRSAPFEIADPPHLHFELLKNGEYVDPKEYIQFK